MAEAATLDQDRAPTMRSHTDSVVIRTLVLSARLGVQRVTVMDRTLPRTVTRSTNVMKHVRRMIRSGDIP